MTDLAAPTDTAGLIDHILLHYHDAHRRDLPELVRLARKVEAVHQGHPQSPQGLADRLAALGGELEVHMKKEELILFPALRRGVPADGPIAQMRHDHDGHLAAFARLTGDVALPDGACRTWRALHAGLGAFADALARHIRLENDTLFPRFEALGHRHA